MCLKRTIATLFALMYFLLPSEANAQTLLERIGSLFHFHHRVEMTLLEPVEQMETTHFETLVELPEFKPIHINGSELLNPRVSELQATSDSQDWQAINNWLLSGLPEGTPQIDPSFDLSLIGVDSQQFLCLATNIYFEDRGSTLNDQRAVALVTLNRTQHWRWAGAICDVVWERNQFSWTITANRVRNRVRTPEAWLEAQTVAYEVLTGSVADITYGATNYYNPRACNPAWARLAVTSHHIGAHRYMQLRTTANYDPPPGNTWNPVREYARTITSIIRFASNGR